MSLEQRLEELRSSLENVLICDLTEMCAGYFINFENEIAEYYNLSTDNLKEERMKECEIAAKK